MMAALTGSMEQNKLLGVFQGSWLSALVEWSRDDPNIRDEVVRSIRQGKHTGYRKLTVPNPPSSIFRYVCCSRVQLVAAYQYRSKSILDSSRDLQSISLDCWTTIDLLVAVI
jgi:hypothetical protein